MARAVWIPPPEDTSPAQEVQAQVDDWQPTGPAYIASLPPELLSSIFLLTILQNDNPWLYHRAAGTLKRVCRFWNQLLESTPGVWAYNNVLFPPEQVESLLHKSGDFPIRFSEWSGGPYLNSLELPLRRARSVQLMFENMTKVRTVGMSVGTPDIAGLQSTRAPVLEELALFFAGGFSDRLQLFWGEAPNLKSVKIWHIRVDWTSPIFSGLRVLDINQGNLDSQDLSGPQVLKILETCPDLQQLVLQSLWHDFGVPENNDPKHYGSEVVHLPKLENAKLSMTPIILFPLLARIRAPGVRLAEVSYIATQGGAVEKNEFLATMAAWLQGTKELTVDIGPHTTSILAQRELPDGSPASFSLEERDGPRNGPRKILEFLGEAFRRHVIPTPTRSEVVFGRGALTSNREPEAMLRHLSSIPKIRSIRLDSDSAFALWTVLRFLQTTLAGNPGWPFPDLEELSLRSVRGKQDGMDKIVEMVEKRYGLSGDVNRPTTLKQLLLPGLLLAESQLTALQNVLGEESIIF